MTDDTDTTPGDLAGSVREVQHQLRERYGATEADVRADDVTEWGRTDEGPNEDSDTVSSEGRALEFAGDNLDLIGRELNLTITLQWYGPDLPDGSPSPVAAAVRFLADVIGDVQEDFPEAEVSTYTDGTRAQLNIDLGDS